MDQLEPQSAPQIEELVRSGQLEMARGLINELPPADLAELLEDFELTTRIASFQLLEEAKKTDVYAYLPIELQLELIDTLPDSAITSIIDAMEPDDRTRLLEALPEEVRRDLIMRLSPKERRVARQLLSYPEDSIGRLMTTEILVLKDSMNVRQALEYVRWHGSNLPSELLHILFVTDHERKYMGEIKLADLVLGDPPSNPLTNLLDPNKSALLATAEDSEAVDFFRKYDRSVCPVIDEAGRLLGAVTADDVFDVAEEEATEDIQQFGGQGALEESYFQTPLLTLLRKRGGWLAVLFVGELFTGTALKYYDEAIASLSFVIYFIPLIISSGGNSGTQAASLVIRGIAVREMEIADWKKVFWREAIMGVGLGTLLGFMGFIRAVTWGYSIYIGLVVAISLVGVVMFGALIGSMFPFLLKRLKLDPAVSSSPFIASLVDLFGILIFVNVAIFGPKFLENLFGP